MRTFIALLFSFILVGAVQLVFSLVADPKLDWILIFQVGAAAGILAFLVSSWRERGPLYVFIAVLVVALAGGVVSAIRKQGFLESFIFLLILQVLFGGLMITGEWLGRPKLWLRFIAGGLAGILAGVLLLVGFSLFTTAGKGLAGTLVRGLPYVVEIPAASAVGLFLTRLLLGERKNSKPVKESAE